MLFLLLLFQYLVTFPEEEILALANKLSILLETLGATIGAMIVGFEVCCCNCC